MQSVLAWNMHDLTSARVVFMVIVWSLYFGQLVTDDIDQLQKNVEEAKQQLQLYDDTLGKFFSCTIISCNCNKIVFAALCTVEWFAEFKDVFLSICQSPDLNVKPSACVL